eukprot:2148253-Amphidinium_carterae.1
MSKPDFFIGLSTSVQDSRGDIRFVSNDAAVLECMSTWSYADELWGYPRGYAEVADDSFINASPGVCWVQWRIAMLSMRS